MNFYVNLFSGALANRKKFAHFMWKIMTPECIYTVVEFLKIRANSNQKIIIRDYSSILPDAFTDCTMCFLQYFKICAKH